MFCSVGIGFFSKDADGVLGEVAAAQRALEDLLLGAGKCFAHFGGDHSGQFVDLMLEDPGQFAHTEGAMFERNLAVAAESGLGYGDFSLYGFVAQGLELAKHFARGWIDGGNRHR